MFVVFGLVVGVVLCVLVVGFLGGGPPPASNGAAFGVGPVFLLVVAGIGVATGHPNATSAS